MASISIDSKASKVSFEVKKLGFLKIKGTLNDFHGDINFDIGNLEQARFKVSVSPSTINTGNSKRDEHLKSKDFFYIEAHPEISFESNSIQKNRDAYQAIGRLSMLGVDREVSIPFTFAAGVFKGEFSLNRLDYKLGEKFPSLIVGKTIKITIHCKTKTS